MTIFATCATIAAALASAQGGEHIRLSGDCPAIRIDKVYSRPILIDADNATVRGLVIKNAANVRWINGRLVASGGVHGAAGSGYALQMTGSRWVGVENVTFTGAKKGAVVNTSSDFVFAGNRFTRLGDDGIVVAQSERVRIAGNLFEMSVGKPTECTIPDQPMQYSLSGKACRALGGTWRDGYHPDAVQMRNGVVDALLEYNTVRGSTQGLTQMDTTGDAPLVRITIRRNSVITDGYHPITLGGKGCIDCRIMENEVLRWPGSTAKKIIISGPAMRCGNIVQDEKVQDAACK